MKDLSEHQTKLIGNLRDIIDRCRKDGSFGTALEAVALSWDIANSEITPDADELRDREQQEREFAIRIESESKIGTDGRRLGEQRVPLQD
jgi:hypothetical protein